jgi:multidrug efflux pump subunit AcrA (membrane-fusion protein)
MRKLLLLGSILLVLGATGWFGLRLARAVMTTSNSGVSLPVTRVKRGDVTITVDARGELQGGNSEMLIAPMVGGSDLAITFLRTPGELVKEGDVVVEFDTTEQEFKLREAEADLAEAEQQVAQAEATAEATDEESRYALLQAQTQTRVAELEVRRNPIMATIVARQNTLALEAAGDKLRQLEQDLASRQANNKASIAIQEAARRKARVAAETARRNIESMTLKARSSGYVNIQQNTGQNMIFWGMQLPIFQTGDSVRSGMAVAQIPDLKNWDVTAKIGELDRGHLSAGQDVSVAVIALAGKSFAGKVKEMGGTSGPPWDRHFECKIMLKDPAPELRPGMSTRIQITTGVITNALWVPSQALFESDGRAFVYAQTPNGFMPHDVKLVQRSDSQVVLSGLREGQLVALANPDQMSKKAETGGGAMRALQK